MKDKTLLSIVFIYVIIATATLINFDGTGDAGDSVMHYLFAKYAPIHLELYFNHWAKPIYVLFASPFAQFDFIGIKIFNVIVFGLTIVFTYKTAKTIELKNKALTFFFLIGAPLYFTLTFSGLTEPLFALFLSIGFYLILKERFMGAALLLSFLPFIRSEGLILLAVIGFYFLLKKQWKILPILLFGHIVYSIAGYFIYNDLLWVFTKIPYNNLGSPYGKGELFHFIERLIYVLGIPIYILFWLGFISIIWKTIKNKLILEIKTLYLLGFISFIVAHSLFWYLGIFNSMGLIRVLVAISPITAIISLFGFNFLTEELIQSHKVKRVVQSLLIIYVVVFPFTSNPAAINPKKDLELWGEQKSVIEVSNFLKKEGKLNGKLFYSHPYMSEVLKIDHFDSKKHAEINSFNLTNIQKGDVIIWENWFAVVEQNLSLETLENDSRLIKTHENLSVDPIKGREIIFSVFEVK